MPEERYVYLVTYCYDGWNREIQGIYANETSALEMKSKIESANNQWLAHCEGCEGMLDEAPYWRKNCRDKMAELFAGIPGGNCTCFNVDLDEIAIERRIVLA